MILCFLKSDLDEVHVNNEKDCRIISVLSRIMVQPSQILRNGITTGRQLYKHLLRECQKLPPGASAYYRHAIKQSYKQHADESNPERVQEIIDRALEDTKWVLKKYVDKKQ